MLSKFLFDDFLYLKELILCLLFCKSLSCELFVAYCLLFRRTNVSKGTVIVRGNVMEKGEEL